jgi:uncharacterized protein
MIRSITPSIARQLAITRQHLAGSPPTPTAEHMLNVIRDLGCLQLDPTSAVARSHLLVLWSRLGSYDIANLDTLLWADRSLFEYWAHAAAIVLTEEYPVHHHQMQKWINGTSSSWSKRVHKWMKDNQALCDHILEEIRQNGPLPSQVFEDKSQVSWQSSGWTGNRNVSQMLSYLWDMGILMVSARNNGGHRLWDLSERCLPEWTPRDMLSEYEVVYYAAQKSLRALGVARPKDIQQHYIRGRYPNLPQVLSGLEKEGLIQRIQIVEGRETWSGEWYIHADDLPLLEHLEKGNFEPRTILLSPFDNLICDRARTEKLFDFEFRIEIYVPKDKRKYGYYVLPILHGDKLIGRIDPLFNRKEKRLYINAVYTESDKLADKKTAATVAAAMRELAAFIGAADIVYTDRMPKGWKKVMS